MKWWCWILTSWLAASSFAGAAESLPFRVGEKLGYRIFWGPILVGEASLEVRGIEPVDGHDCYHLIANAQTVGLGRLMYKLDSATESWLDVAGLFSRRFQQDRREGRSHKQSVTEFDYTRNEAVTRNLITGKQQRQAIDKPVQDIVSSLYYMRTQPLALDRASTFTLNASDKNWTVTCRPDRRQSIEVRPIGEVQALRIEPAPTLKFVASNKGRMWLWVSDDKRNPYALICAKHNGKCFARISLIGHR